MEKNCRIFRFKGDEKILDVGCGTGRASINLAKQLSTGKVIGIDIFGGVSGTSPDPARRNAKIEEVADKVEFKHGNILSAPSRITHLMSSTQVRFCTRCMGVRTNKKPCGKFTVC